MNKPLDIINEIRAIDEDYTPSDIRNALEDGEFLSNFNWTQAEVEAAYNLIDNIESWDELKSHGGAREGAGRKPQNLNHKIVGVRMTPDQQVKLQNLGGSEFIRSAIDEADDRTLYVFYKQGGEWQLDITNVYFFCREFDIDNYDAWKGSGESLEDVMEFGDKRDALDFIEVEIDDQDKASEYAYEIKAH